MMSTAKLSVPATALIGLVAAGLFGAAGACGDTESNTDLNPEGPPMVRQVFVQERTGGDGTTRVGLGLAFGSHPELTEDDGVVETGVAGTGQEIRIVLDELLRGNRLEEIACADGSFSLIPDGTTPADIAACAGPVEAIVEQGCDSVCIGPDGPVGILDEEPQGGGDGAADDFRLRSYEGGALPVTLTCDGVEIPLNRETSFWSPSGNQLIPANNLGVRGIGPALVIKTERGLRTGASCSLAFHPQVVDKDGNQVCAPPGGDISRDCAPGDTSAISFGVEPFSVEVLDPLDGATDVALDLVVILQFNAAVDPGTVGNISLAEAGGGDVPLEPMVQADDPTLVFINIPGGLTAETDYVLTVPTTVTDTFGGALPAEVTTEFTTGTSTDMPDAGMPDAMPDAMP